MWRSTAISLLPLLFAVCVAAAEPIGLPATHADRTTPTALAAASGPSFDARSAGSHLPTIYTPYTPGQQIPCGWKLVTVRFPVKEVCTKTICEEQIVQVPKQVPCVHTKTIRFPTEVYKTYVKFKEIKVEDGTLMRHEDAPEADLDDLDLEEDETVPVSTTAGSQPASNMRTVPVGHPAQHWPDSQPYSQENRPARPGFDWVQVTKIRKKQVEMQVPVKKLVDVDEGCWKELVVYVPAPGCKNSCPPAAPLYDEAGGPPGTVPIYRRVWEPRIVQREVTVMETREVTIDETYTDYVEQPAIAPDTAPDAAPDLAPDTAPDIAPDVMVTTDRTVRIPQYVTKAERHYLTKTIKVPGFETVFCPVKQTVQREVPYEVVRMCEKQVLVPVDPSVIPQSLMADPLLPAEEIAPRQPATPILRDEGNVRPLPNP